MTVDSRTLPCRACPPGGDPRSAVRVLIETELLRLAEHRPQDLVSEGIRSERLSRCNTCEKLASDGTCLACGCYVLVRAALRKAACPYPRKSKW